MQQENLSKLMMVLVIGIFAFNQVVAVAAEDADELETFDPGTIEEVIVTANRREEKLQEIPKSVSAFTEDFFKDSGTTSFNSLQQYTPSLRITPTNSSRSTSIRIRGIGAMGINSGVDPSVGVFIDGVYQGRAGMSVNDLMDVERVEILRGPQGTLYGKNTAAGAINIISQKPGPELASEIELVFGNYDNQEIRGMINIPFGDGASGVRISAYKVERDGFSKNLTLDSEVNDENKWGFKAHSQFELGSWGNLLVTIDHSKIDNHCCAADVITYAGDSLLNLPFSLFTETYNTKLPVADVFDRKVYNDAQVINKSEVEGIALEWNYDLSNDDTITWLSAYRSNESFDVFDGDFSPLDAVTMPTTVDLAQQSSELRITSPSADFLEYQAGLYYYYQEADTLDQNSMHSTVAAVFDPFQNADTLRALGIELMPPEGVTNTGTNLHETWSYAVFGQTTFKLAEQWSLTTGIRYTYEKKARFGSQISRPEPDFIVDAPPLLGEDIIDLDEERTAENVSGAISLRYFSSETLMWYASISQGFKSGGFNQLRTPATIDKFVDPVTGKTISEVEAEGTEFDDESSLNYELGWKGSWLARRLQVNGTFFYVDYTDFQALGFDGASLILRNAGTLESYGLEMDVIFVATHSLTTGLSFGYNKAQYTEFDKGECTVDVNIALAKKLTEAGPEYVPPFAAGCHEDLKGKPLNDAPEVTISTWLQFDKPWESNHVKWYGRFEYNFTDEHYLALDLDPNLKNKSIDLLNMRLGIAEIDHVWEVSLWGRNILDKEYFVTAFDIPIMSGYAGVLAPPATYGISFRYRLN